MGFSLFERSVEREGGPATEGNHQRGCGPRLPVSEILCCYRYKTCGMSEDNNSPNRFTPKVLT